MNVAEWYASRSHMEVNPGSIPNSLGIFQKNILRGKTWNHEKANKASRWPATLMTPRTVKIAKYILKRWFACIFH